MDIIKSTVRALQSAKAFFYGFYIFCLSIAQAMNRLIIVFVSREEWSTATIVIETNYKAANLIPISLVESSNFWCRLYHREQEFFLNYEHKKMNYILQLRV